MCSKQSGLFSFYALPSGGKLKGVVIHLFNSGAIISLGFEIYSSPRRFTILFVWL